jgi:hypothetical protein
MSNPKALVQLIIKQPAPRLVRLKPLAIDHELRHRPFTDMSNELSRSSSIKVHIDLGVRNPVRLKKLLRRPAIPAPCRRINPNFHASILLCPRCYYRLR